MKSFEELKARYNSIPELPVSEEMLCAHFEGKLSDSEDKIVVSEIEADEYLSDLCSEVENTSLDEILDSDTTISDLDYPDLFDITDAFMPTSDFKGENNDPQIDSTTTDTIVDSQDDNFIEIGDQSKIFFDGDDILNDEMPSIVLEQTSKTMAKGSKKNFGYEPNTSENKYDPLIDQGPRPSCAIRSQEIILRDYGIIIPQEELIAYASQQGWYSDDPEHGGTPRQAVGNLLDACGIPTTRTENATIYDIIAELRAGHRVIVSVDANELWVKQEPVLYKRLFGEIKNKVQDTMDRINGIQGANHALIVAGVTVNPKDPSDIHVTLIDSGSGDVCIEYGLKDFQNALDDSNCYMVSTTIPAPYQYNYETHEMEPSSFNTTYYPSMATLPFGLSNEFHLDDCFYTKYADYESVYDVIGFSKEESDQEASSYGDVYEHECSELSSSEKSATIYGDDYDSSDSYDEDIPLHNDEDYMTHDSINISDETDATDDCSVDSNSDYPTDDTPDY